MDVAVFGIGRIGRIHLKDLALDCRVNVKYVVDVTEVHDTVSEYLKHLKLCQTQLMPVERSNDVMMDSSVVAVYICTHIAPKVQLIKKAIEHGKHVFCEKPLSLQVQEIEECYRLSEKSQTILQVGFNKRFDEGIRKMYDKIKHGDIGRLRMIKLTARELPGSTWKDYILQSGGFHIDSCIHEFDLLCWLANEKPSSVCSFGHAQQDIFKECYDVDSTSILIQFPSGLMGYIENFRNCPYGYDQRYEVLGEKAMLCIENPKLTQVETTSADGVLQDRIWQDNMTRYLPAYRAEKEHFLDAIKGETVCQIKAEDVVFVHKLAACATQSMTSAKVVQLPVPANKD